MSKTLSELEDSAKPMPDEIELRLIAEQCQVEKHDDCEDEDCECPCHDEVTNG